MKYYYILLIIFISFHFETLAQNEIWINTGYGRYLLNSENSTKVLENKDVNSFLHFGAGIEKDNIFGYTLILQYSYFQNTINNAMKFNWTDEQGNNLGEFFGDYHLINHSFDFNYIRNINDNFSYGIGPSFIITNRILDIDVNGLGSLKLYDKLASSGIGINGFFEFKTPLSEDINYLFFTSKLKLRYTHSVWFDEGLRKLDDYNQDFFTAQISIGIGYHFGD